MNKLACSQPNIHLIHTIISNQKRNKRIFKRFRPSSFAMNISRRGRISQLFVLHLFIVTGLALDLLQDLLHRHSVATPIEFVHVDHFRFRPTIVAIQNTHTHFSVRNTLRSTASAHQLITDIIARFAPSIATLVATQYTLGISRHVLTSRGCMERRSRQILQLTLFHQPGIIDILIRRIARFVTQIAFFLFSILIRIGAVRSSSIESACRRGFLFRFNERNMWNILLSSKRQLVQFDWIRVRTS
mmetsp:Transcript_42555/g.68351  ORF Transcript_42555/g.68351 Transcript_42555/m.68351 type:complete len:244 (+) Transcript_42555:131-862(+)